MRYVVTGAAGFIGSQLAQSLTAAGHEVVGLDCSEALAASGRRIAMVGDVVTGDGKMYALDAKVTFDDNALYRHPEFKDLRDLDEETPLEVEASKFKLNYIKLDGDIACMVNGAGLAMATMDIIKLSGGSPANFLDVGGGASEDQVKNAFRLLLSDPNVKAVFVNIFGGILRCDILASGVVNAAKELKFKVPVVVRMEGTNVKQGKQILKDSGFNFTVAEGMKDGAQKAVALAGGAQ